MSTDGLTSDERAAYQSMVARGIDPAVAREEALDGVGVDDVRAMALTGVAYPTVPICNGRCHVGDYPDFDRHCPVHGSEREVCRECNELVNVVEQSVETAGQEETERDYHVTRLACGHEIAVAVKR